MAASAFAHEASWKKAFFAKDFNEKHAARKAIFYSLPGRPLMRWAYLMFYSGAASSMAGQASYIRPCRHFMSG